MLVGAGDEQTSILTACSREFGNEEARVLCSQLGCGQGERVQKSRLAEFNFIIIYHSTLPYQVTLNEECMHIAYDGLH